MDVHLRELFGLFQQRFGVGPDPSSPSSASCLLKIDGINPSLIQSIFKAASSLYVSNPWKKLRANHAFGIGVPKDSGWPQGTPPFSCATFVGGGGGAGDLGLHLFRTEADATNMTEMKGSGNLKNIPQNGMLRVLFVREMDISAANRKMIKSMGLEIAGPKAYPVIDVIYPNKAGASGLPSLKNPAPYELRWLYSCIKALTQIHPLLQPVDGDGRGRLSAWNATFEEMLQVVEVQGPVEDGKPWDPISLRVTYPLRDDHEDHANPPPRLVEMVETSKDLVIWTIPRQCAMCAKEVPASSAPRCSRCKAVIYCGHTCQKKHWKEVHKGSCELYKAMMEREEELELKGFVFPCLMEHACNWLESLGLHGKGMWRRTCSCFKHIPFGLLPPQESGGMSAAWGVEHSKCPSDVDFIGDTSSIVLLSGWAEYYSVRGLPMSSPVAALLSFPLSLYHIVSALSVAAKSMLAKGREVVVHYLGPEGELDWLPAFSELGHLLNGSGSLHLMMIGPEVPASLSRSAISLGKKLKVTFVQGLYQDEAYTLSSPQLVVALNSGLDSYSSWLGVLEVIKAQALPAFFSDYAETCCANAKQVLRAAGLQISYPVTPNPFRSPIHNQVPSSNLPWFSNGFVFGVNT